MKLIALTGGIAAGKSTIARRLTELGAVHVDADVLAREAVAPGSRALEQIEQRFGSGVLLPDGGLDRAALGRIVFDDPRALADLNGIVHPAVRELGTARISAAEREDPNAVVVYDVPLLVESGTRMEWDLVVVAEAPAETRIERMVSLRGMDRVDAQQRIANQASDAERRAVADLIIDTGGSEQHTIEQVDALWRRLGA